MNVCSEQYFIPKNESQQDSIFHLKIQDDKNVLKCLSRCDAEMSDTFYIGYMYRWLHIGNIDISIANIITNTDTSIAIWISANDASCKSLEEKMMALKLHYL